MEQKTGNIKRKGGRPRKPIKKDQKLGLKCTIIEKKVIEGKAKAAALTVSEYFLQMGLTGKVDMRQKSLPKEVLQLNGLLNHVAANLNQIAKKRNSFEELSSFERADLEARSQELKKITETIKNFLK